MDMTNRPRAKRLLLCALFSLAVAMGLALPAAAWADTADTNVAKIGENEYTTLADAFTAAGSMEKPTITLLSDVTVTNWNQVWNTNGWTIDGGGNTITVGSISSNGNGDFLFFNAENLTVKNLNVVFQGAGSGFYMNSGSLDNVHMTGANAENSYAVFAYSSSVENAAVTISDCSFDKFAYAVSGDNVASSPDISIECSTISNCSIGVLSFSEETVLVGNTITNVNEISLAGALNSANSADSITYSLTGNTFTGAVGINLYGANLDNVTFTQNKLDTNTTISATENPTGTLNVNDNYWGSENGPSEGQVSVSGTAVVEDGEWYTDSELEHKNTDSPGDDDGAGDGGDEGAGDGDGEGADEGAGTDGAGGSEGAGNAGTGSGTDGNAGSSSGGTVTTLAKTGDSTAAVAAASAGCALVALAGVSLARRKAAK